MDKELSDLLEIPVNRIELFRTMDTKIENYAASSFNFPALDNALALALNEDKGVDRLNFHKARFAVNEYLSRHKSSLVKTGILTGVVLVLALLNFTLNFYFMNKKINHLNQMRSGNIKLPENLILYLNMINQMKVGNFIYIEMKI